MASFDDKEVALAGVYATALLTLARERKEETDVGEELDQVVDALEKTPYFLSFLTSPTVDLKRRSALLEKMFRSRTSKTFADGLQILNRNGRLGLLKAIAEQFKTLHRESLGRVKALIQSAAPLSPEHEKRLRDGIKKRSGKDVEFVIKIDPELIGGMVLQIGDRKVDATAARRLRNLADALQNRAAQEVLRSGEYVSQ